MKRRRHLRTVRVQHNDSVFPFLTNRQEIIVDKPPSRPRPRPTVTRKGLLLPELADRRSLIVDAASKAPPHRQEEVFLGTWNIRDLIAHLIGWDHALLAAAQDILLGQLPAIYYARDPDWKSLNHQFVEQYNRGDYGELLRAVKDSSAELLAYLETVPEDEFLQNHGLNYEGSPLTIGRLLAAEIKDEAEHLQQIQEFVHGLTPTV